MAGALMVMLVETLSRGMPSKSFCMSSRVAMDTPTRPTSPTLMGWSGSRPSWVGRSKATLRPVWPWDRRYR